MYRAEEVAAPYLYLKEQGYDVTISSIKGGEVPMDEASLNPPFTTKDVEKFLLDDAAMDKVTNSVPLATLNADDYDAVMLPGGHGTCWDYPDNDELASLVSKMAAAGKVVAAVCHGPNGLVKAKGPDGKPLVSGKQVTGFTNEEEYAVAKEKLVPFLLEDKLKELGAVYSKKENWAEYAIRDGKLVTGQNPGSSRKVAELIHEALVS